MDIRFLKRVSALTLVLLALGCPPRKVNVPDVVGEAQTDAQAAIVDARLALGEITEVYSLTVDAGSVISQDPAAGAEVDRDSTVTLVVSRGSLSVEGRVLFDDGTPVVGGMVVGSVGVEDASALAQLALRRLDEARDWSRPEAKTNVEASLEPQASNVQVRDLSKQDTVLTDAEGNFTVELAPDDVPVRILVEISFDADPLPVIDSSKWGDLGTNASVLDMGTITMPNPQTASVPLSGGAGESSDGTVLVENVPAEVDALYARSYDPDASTGAFPGEFAEMGAIPLNSGGFVWLEALDANGNPVDDLAQAATIRSQVQPTQWIDLEDTEAGTDRIEVPIYVFDEETAMWEQQGIGWLEDGDRTVLPEDAQSVILDGTFAGNIFATFTTDHFSWMNVDYAFIGPWTLSRLDRARRNTDCLYQALQLAKTIALSTSGRAAYGRVNKPGANLGTELGDGMGPELKDSDLVGEYGVYKGDSGGSETQFEMDTDIWNGCGEGATEQQKKNTVIIMAVTILHETAHWKDDVKKNSDDDTDTEGEEGNQLEKDLFGGIITGGAGGLKRDGAAVTNETRDGWLNPASWPAPAPGGKGTEIVLAAAKQESALEVTIGLPATTFELGEEIPVEVTYKNVSGGPLEVMNRVVLEGWPLHFNIIKQSDAGRVRFLGPEFKLELTDEDFDTLSPNQTLTQTVNLLRDSGTDAPRYQLIRSGAYDITAIYEALRGVAESVSNALTFSVSPGGSVSGNVTNATNAAVLAGATIRAIQNGFVLTSTTTDAAGNYSIPELPGGTYTLEIQASGFLRSTVENVEVSAGANSAVNISLSPLLASGELRLVLTWGTAPNDLDSHLWLPMELPYHLAYFRRGSLEACPNAALDVDDTSGLGPETITIQQRVAQGTYVYAIYNFSGSPSLTESGAQVQVYDATGLIASFNVPAQGEGRFWNVLSIDGANGAITEINQLTDSVEPYPDTAMGCEAPPARIAE